MTGDIDDELETEVRRLMTPVEAEGRRSAAVRDLHQVGPAGTVVRVGAVTVTIAAAVALYFAVGGTLLLETVTELCTRIGLCG